MSARTADPAGLLGRVAVRIRHPEWGVHVHLTILARLACALATARAVPLAA